MRIIFIFIVQFSLLQGCVFSQKENRGVFNNSEKRVCVEHIISDYSWEREEFFIVENQDTSAYSCIFISKENEPIRLELKFSLFMKEFFLNNEFESDTTACDGIWNIPTDRFYIPTYKEMMNEIALIMETASLKYNLNQLCSFRTNLSYLSDVAVMTTNTLIATTSNEDKAYRHIDIAKALKTTTFKKDLNKIISKYYLEIDQITCQEEICNVSKKDFLATQKVSHGMIIPDSIVDVEVYISFKTIKNINK